MDEKSYQELIKSIKEAGAVLRGEIEPSRVFYFDPPKEEDREKILEMAKKYMGEDFEDEE
jgi:hypothetical protein